MRAKIIFFIASIFAFSSSVYSQIVTDKDTACAIGSLLITSNPAYLNTQWNTCNETKNQSTYSAFKTLPINNNGDLIDFRMLEFEGNWYGFTVINATNTFYRYDFGNSPLNQPTVVNLGNLSGNVNSPIAIDVQKFKSGVIGVLTNLSGNEVKFFDFRNGINNLPVFTTVNGLISVSLPTSSDIYTKGNTITVSLNSYLDKSQYLIQFNGSFSDINYKTTILPNQNKLLGQDFFESKDFIYSILASDSKFIEVKKINKTTYAVESSWLYQLPFSTVRNVVVNPYGNTLHIYGVKDKNVFGLDFDLAKETFSNFQASLINQNNFFFKPFCLEFIPFNNEEYVFVPTNDGNLTVIKNNLDCTSKGTRYIELTAYDPNSNSKIYEFDSVYVTKDPKANIRSNFNCTNTQTELLDTIQSDTENAKWRWEIESNKILTNAPKITYSFSNNDSILVKQVVENNCGAKDSLSQKIFIHSNKDIINNVTFTDSICTNNYIFFKNTSVYTTDLIKKTAWTLKDKNNVLISNGDTKNFSYAFSDTGSYKLQLQSTGLSGCTKDTTINLTALKGPKADFSFSNYCLLDSTHIFETSGDTSIKKIEWRIDNLDFDGGYGFKIANKTINSFKVELKTYNRIGCESSSEKIISIAPLPKASFDSTYFCESQNKQLFNRSSISNFTLLDYKWYINNVLASTDENPILSVEGTENNTIKLVSTSKENCKDSTQKVLSTLSKPTPDFSVENICLGNNTSFIDKSIDSKSSITSRKWTIDQAVLSGSTAKYVFPNPGNYSVNLEVTNAFGCKSANNKIISIAPLPIVDFDFINTCLGKETNFTDRTISINDPIQKRFWSFIGQNTMLQGEKVSYTYSTGNTHLVQLTTETQNGCSNSYLKTIAIGSSPKSIFQLDKNLGEPTLEVTTKNLSQNAKSYTWIVDKNQFKTDEVEPKVKFSELGNYTLYLLATANNGCTDTSSQTIQVIIKKINYTLKNLYQKTKNGQTYFSISIQNNGTQVLENIPIDLDFGGDFVQSLQLDVRVPVGASKEIELPISMDKSRFENLKYVCASDTSNITETKKACINISTEISEIGIYPNPAEDNLYLEYYLPVSQDVYIELYTIDGKLLYTNRLFSSPAGKNTTKINLNLYTKGVYLVNIKTTEDSIIKKIEKN